MIVIGSKFQGVGITKSLVPPDLNFYFLAYLIVHYYIPYIPIQSPILSGTVNISLIKAPLTVDIVALLVIRALDLKQSPYLNKLLCVKLAAKD